MGVTINIPSYFRHLANGLDIVEVKGETVGECLHDLVTRYPGLDKLLFFEQGELNDYIGVSVNRELLTAWEKPLARQVFNGYELTIILFGIAGG